MAEVIGQCPRPPGEYALARALEMWREDIIDPRRGDTREIAQRSLIAIDRMIRGDRGLDWAAARDGGKTSGSYRGDLDFAWCGAYAATCWSAAGLRADIRRAHWASTYRLWTWARDTPRMLRPEDARAGDVLVVGLKARWGDHIAVVVDQADGWWRTVEGNATGLGPDDRRRQGVIRAERGPSEVRYAVRPLDEDLDP